MSVTWFRASKGPKYYIRKTQHLSSVIMRSELMLIHSPHSEHFPIHVVEESSLKATFKKPFCGDISVQMRNFFVCFY